MTASQSPKAPFMTIPLKQQSATGGTVTRAHAETLASQLGRLAMVDLLQYGDGGGINVSSQLCNR